MTGPEFREALRALGISQREFARRAGLVESSTTRWVKGERRIPGWVPWVLQLLRDEGGEF